MSNNYSLVVGIEKYRDKKIPPVDYATKDATAIAEALRAIGFAQCDQIVLTDGQATQSEIRYSTRQVLRNATKADTVFLFYSGHGYSDNRQSFLVAEDSRADDFVPTTVPFSEILEEIEKSPCQRIALFIDCCHSGLRFPAGERSVLTTMNSQEIADFFRESQYRVAFSSCRPDEKSYSSHQYGHGIWTYHLLQAITGKVPEVISKERYLRASELQDYLAREVPLAARTHFTDRRQQNPIMFGSLDRNFLIGDLEPVLPKAAIGDEALNAGLKRAEFRCTEQGRVRELPGFSKARRHFVPDSHSSAAMSFICDVGQDLVADRAKEWQTRIVNAFGYKRRDIEVHESSGDVSIRAKDFDLSLSLEQHSDDPAKYVLTVVVDNIAPRVVLGDEFNDVFADAFSVLKLEGLSKQDIPKLIDRIEEEEPPGVHIKYPHDDPTYVAIRFEGHKAEFVVGSNWLKVKLGSGSPRDFVEALRKVQALKLHGKMTLAGLLPST